MIPNWFSASFISLFWPFSWNDVVWPLYILKKRRSSLSRVYPGRLGPKLTRRVDRVSPGQFLDGFWLGPGPVPCPGRPAVTIRVSKLWLHGLSTTVHTYRMFFLYCRKIKGEQNPDVHKCTAINFFQQW
jgi:hypothetical protein